MHLSLSTIDIKDPQAIEGYAKEVLASAFGLHRAQVRAAQLKLVDTNGPDEGGIDKRCWVTLRLTEGPDIVAESIHEDAHAAISLSAAEAAAMLARRMRAHRHRVAIKQTAALPLVCALALTACAGKSPFPLVHSAGASHALTITEAEALARSLEKDVNYRPQLDAAAASLTRTSRHADVKAYELFAAAESHVLTAKLVDIMAARIHEQASRVAPRSWYGEPVGAERMSYARLEEVSRRLKVASSRLRATAEMEKKRALALTETSNLQNASTTLDLALILERAMVTKRWHFFDLAIASLIRTGANDALISFYCGLGALERRGDVTTATKYLEGALALDPTFHRAQATLVLLQPDVKAALGELAELTNAQPNHRWARLVVASK